ncbi:MAG: helix-turn-helix domain-containing protein [Pseudonocardiaceae bacterium]
MIRKAPPVDPESVEIGRRAGMIRRRRGLSQDVVAGLAGISKQYVSMLEGGKRRFVRRGLLEDLAGALGCSVVDLTGEPYLAVDRATADALAAMPELAVALYEPTPTSDISARPVTRLVHAVAQANEHCEETRYALACRDLPALLTELAAHAATGNGDTRRAALAGLMEGCVVAFGATRHLGRTELAIQAAWRAQEAAGLLGDPALTGFATLIRASAFSRLGARRAAAGVLADAFAAIEPEVDPTGHDTQAAEACGVMHLLSAQLAARDGRADDADARIAEAAALASATGERNTLQWHFGPANVTAWSLSIAVETQRGPGVAERIDANLPQAASAGRRSRLHLDLARGYAQAEGARDAEAIRHLDTADRIAPQRIRNDPIARELVADLNQRARRRVWELDSLYNRFGMNTKR